MTDPLFIYRGIDNHYPWEVFYQNDAGVKTPIDLTGDTVYFGLSRGKINHDGSIQLAAGVISGTPEFVATIDSGSIVDNGFAVTIGASESLSLPSNVPMVGEIRVVDIDGHLVLLSFFPIIISDAVG